MIADIIAFLPDPSAVNIMLGGYAGMSGAMVAIWRRGERAYKDCRLDRDRLWARVTELERRMSGQ